MGLVSVFGGTFVDNALLVMFSSFLRMYASASALPVFSMLLTRIFYNFWDRHCHWFDHGGFGLERQTCVRPFLLESAYFSRFHKFSLRFQVNTFCSSLRIYLLFSWKKGIKYASFITKSRIVIHFKAFIATDLERVDNRLELGLTDGNITLVILVFYGIIWTFLKIIWEILL